mmetsp:Transcript_8610/g.23472  ORF Transcript_8610/g.23472 Transcript_8610/m.23472 type:complete len:91 (-) Transcript_8610:1043-1315(-)
MSHARWMQCNGVDVGRVYEDGEMMTTRGADVDELEDCLSFEDEPLSQERENGYEFADRGNLRCVAGVGAFVRFWLGGRAGVARPRRVPTF